MTGRERLLTSLGSTYTFDAFFYLWSVVFFLLLPFFLTGG